MARQVFDGFDTYLNGFQTLIGKANGWDGDFYNPSVNGSIGSSDRFGTGNCFSYDNHSAMFKKTFASPLSRVIFGGAIKLSSLGSSGIPLCQMYDSATKQNTIMFDPADASVVLRTGTYNGAIRAQSAALAHGAFWSWFDFDVTVHGSAGTIDVYREGVNILTATGLSIAPSGSNQAAKFFLGADDDFPAGFAASIDDFYMLDATGPAPLNAILGDSRARIIRPNGDSAVQFARSGGASNFGNVNEAGSDEDGSYNLTDNPGDVDLLDNSNLPTGTTGTIWSAKHVTRWRKDDAGVRTAHHGIKSGATTVNESAVPLLSNYESVGTHYDLDPDTTAAWLIAGIDALETLYGLDS